MKNNKIVFGLSIGIMIMISSISCRPTVTPQEPEELQLDLSYSGWDGSRASFKDGDKAGLFALSESDRLSSERYADNEEMIKQGDYFVGMETLYLKEGGDSYLVTYYPYKEMILEAGRETGRVSVSKDQSDLSGYVASDFMLGSTVVAADASMPVSVDMKRMFSKVNLTLTSADPENDDLENAMAEFLLKTSAEVDFSKKSVLSADDEERIRPRGRFSAEGDLYKGVGFITVPQTVEADDECIMLKVRGEESAYAPGKRLEFLSGMEYTIDIFVNKEGDRYRIELEVTEEPWTAGEDMDFSVDQEIDEILPVTDIDGNEYKVVKIGSQYWMASNLITTRYSDGSEITYMESSAEWSAVGDSKEGGYCFYKADDAMKEKFGLLYNWHAVNSGKLCPEGWHVPSLSEYNMLFDELGGMDFAGEAMKSSHMWRDYRNEEKPEYQGTGDDGFNALPGGYRTDNGVYSNEGKYGYWWCSSAEDEFSGEAVYVYFNRPSAVLITPFMRTGYSVRCIKY